MCSNISAGIEQSLTVPRVLLWLTSFFIEVLTVECSVVDWGLATGSGSLLYPHFTILICQSLPKATRGWSCLNNKGAEWYWLSWFWVCSWYDDPLTNGIVSRFPPPPPRLNSSSRNRVRGSHLPVHHVLNVWFLCAVGWGVAWVAL